MCGTQEPMGSGVPGGTHLNFKKYWFQKMGSSGIRFPGRNPKSGFQWVPGSDQNIFVPTPVIDYDCMN